MTTTSNTPQTPQEPSTPSNIIKTPVGELMRKNYLNYAVSVIMDRALPDVRDGLKPVHRRILYAMHELKIWPGTAYKKSARIVGEVMGKYHPHGDSAIYESAVGMAQQWNKRVPLIDGQGNFGSMDGDNPAAMRYTEARLTKAGAAFFEDIDKETVNFRPNYDGSESEPEVLPVSYPNIWVNGVEGIAVGMATYVPPHNLNETIDLTLQLQKNPNLTIEEILTIMPGPDFPTGGIVHDLDGFRSAVLTGRGSVKLRAKWHAETQKNGQELLILDELPFQVNKKTLIENIADKVQAKDSDLEGISGIHDESNKEGIRIVITLKKGVLPAVVFNHLVKKTAVETSYSYNVMLVEGQSPKQMGLVEILTKFLSFRTEVVTKSVQFDLKKASARLHLLSGMMTVLKDLQKAISIITENSNGKEANKALCEYFDIDEGQAQAILDMRLQRLTGMELEAIANEYEQVRLSVEDMKDILAKPERIQAIVSEGLISAKTRFGELRKTEVSYEDNQINIADLIKKEDCLIHVTKQGYLKRMPLDSVEAQKRKGKGRMGMQTSQEDYVESIYAGSTHDIFMVFTTSGKAMASRVWNLPDGSFNNKGRHLRNIFDTLNEPIANIVLLPEIEKDYALITVTANGKVKRTDLSQYTGTLRKKGVQGVTIEEGDNLISVLLAKKNDHLILVGSNGKTVRFEVSDEALASRSRTSLGVKGITLDNGATVINAMVVSQPQGDDGITMDSGKYIFCIGEKGVGKRTELSEFTAHSRGTKGVNCFNINEKTGPLVKVAIVTDDDDLIMTTASKTMRIQVKDVRVTGRNAAGTILMTVDNEKLIDVIKVPTEKASSEDTEIEIDLSTDIADIEE